ncbi:hypothetical protein DV736_g2338, partial [Chaetothyriales sp. CBS 134916]
MSAQHASLDAAAAERKARLAKLASLKRKQPGDDTPSSGEPAVYLSGRNYDVETKGAKLGFETVPSADVETVEKQAERIAQSTAEQAAKDEAEADKGIDLFKLQPKKPNWDLKRELAERMKPVEGRTQNAIARLERRAIAGDASRPDWGCDWATDDCPCAALAVLDHWDCRSVDVGSCDEKVIDGELKASVAAMNVPAASPSTNNLTDDKKAKAQSPEPSTRRKTMSNTKAPPSQAPSQASSHVPSHVPSHAPSHAPHTLAKQVPARAEFPVESTPNAVFVGQATVHGPADGPSSPVANGSKSGGSGDSGEDDQSHLSSSSTKQHSFETKSMASVTTFAMDEKESIRPDDSASVRAVDEEDAGSTLSRNGAFTAEPDVIMPSVRGTARTGMGAQVATAAVRRFHTLANPPRFGTLEEAGSDQPEESSTTSSIEPAEGRDVRRSLQGPLAPPATPDEKLLDALTSPKDRLSVLQLEQKLLEFISQPTVDHIDLPPQHSYARLLAHKLADYYGMVHVINEDGTSIRVFRATSVVSLPTSLETLAKSIPTGSSQSLGLTAYKIMRRAGLPRQFSAANSTAASSSAASKATSEAGHSEEGPTSPTEAGTPSRDRSKMTREEREAQYKAARERIFGNMDELAIGENNSTGENSASMSRSSSSSGKKKTRKQRTPKDDSFDSRSAFVPGYGGLHVQQTTAYQPHGHSDVAAPHQFEALPQAYGPQINYSSTPTQAYPGLEHQMQFPPAGACDHGQNAGCASPDGWSAMQSPPAGATFFNYPPHTSGYGPTMPSSMMHQISQPFSQQASGTTQQVPGWNNNNHANPMYQNGFQQPFSQQGPNVNWQTYHLAFSQQLMQAPGGVMQAPFGPNTRTPFMPQYVQPGQHNVDSTYARQSSLFNPQTKTFVPSSGAGRAGGRGNKKKHSPNSTNSESRQSSVGKSQASSTTSLYSSRHQDGLMFPGSARPSQDSLQQKYGKPANLPKKPPPSQLTGHIEAGSVQAVRRECGNPSVSSSNGSSSGDGKVE